MQTQMYLTKGENGKQNYTSTLKGFFGTSVRLLVDIFVQEELSIRYLPLNYAWSKLTKFFRT